MRTSSLFLVILSLIFTGCVNKKTTHDKIVIVDGFKYKFIQKSKPVDVYISEAELWERVGVTNRYYTPSADGKTMISIAK